ncbi:sigma-70 family RNA polymerase sigma factor [Myxococcota bacterium]|nr:sigma-70 family RNA polymerase sigma factor [Myxococcota bacterium]
MDSSARFQQELVAGNLDLVRKIAGEIHRLVHRRIEIDELINMGTVGLIESARRYDPQRGFQFSTFAYYRIKGAILDGVRRQWFQIGQASGLQAEETANAYMQEKSIPLQLGTPNPSTAELVDRMSTTLSGLATCFRLSSEKIDTLADETGQDGYEAVERNSELAWISRQVEQLPPELAEVIRAVYHEGLSLDEFARRKDKSKSWASRLHSRAIDQLRHWTGYVA